MVKVEHVFKRLGSFQLKDVSFELPAGYILGLLGENGAGKTTLLMLLSGLYTCDCGDICICGNDFHTGEAKIKEELGVVVHEEFFEARQSLQENARRYGRFYKSYDDALLAEYAARFALDLRVKYGHLSKGEKLKFAFAFALSHKPRLLLLDEPGVNFDTDFRKEFHRVLREYTGTGENSVILSTHMTADVEQCADYLLMLKKGQQILFGDIESVRNSYRMVAGDAGKIRLFKERLVYMEEGSLACRALVRNSGRPYDAALKVWEPGVEELEYFLLKGNGIS